MMVPSLDGPRNPTMDDVKRAADEYNKMGEQSAKAGIQQGLHNEGFELSMVGGKRTYDILLELLDPKLVKFQFQVSTISRGYDAAEYFTKYPGRFISMHVQGWSTETRKQMAVGQDTLDWKKIFTAAKTGGHQELLRRNESGADEGQRSLSSRASGLSNGVQDAVPSLLAAREGYFLLESAPWRLVLNLRVCLAAADGATRGLGLEPPAVPCSLCGADHRRLWSATLAARLGRRHDPIVCPAVCARIPGGPRKRRERCSQRRVGRAHETFATNSCAWRWRALRRYPTP